MAEEEDEGGKGRHYKPQERTVFVDLTGIDLNTPTGQDEMLKRMQILIATKNHNALDLKAFGTLKDTVRIKTDLNVLKLFTEMKAEMEAWRAAQIEKSQT
jgi:hypothetical protein